MRERLRTIIATELELPLDSVPVDASADTLQAWDSLGHVRIVTAVEETLGVRFATAELSELNSIETLAAALTKKGIV